MGVMHNRDIEALKHELTQERAKVDRLHDTLTKSNDEKVTVCFYFIL
jgi:hypothetical protein